MTTWPERSHAAGSRQHWQPPGDADSRIRVIRQHVLLSVKGRSRTEGPSRTDMRFAVLVKAATGLSISRMERLGVARGSLP